VIFLCDTIDSYTEQQASSVFVNKLSNYNLNYGEDGSRKAEDGIRKAEVFFFTSVC